jgi:hypothetical protein
MAIMRKEQIITNKLTVRDLTDPTKISVMNVSGVAAGQTRTLTVPDKNITFAGFDDVTLRTQGYVGTNPEVGGSSPFQLTVAHKKIQVVDPAAAITIKLPTTGVLAGDVHIIINRSASFEVSVQSSGTNAIESLHRGFITLVARVDTPTTATDWFVQDYASFYVTSGQLQFFSPTTAYVVAYTRVGSMVTTHVSRLANLGSKTTNNASIDLAALAPGWAIPDVVRRSHFRGTYNNVKDDLAIEVFTNGNVGFWGVGATGDYAGIPSGAANIGWYGDVFITYPKVNS